jgi:hypothetical protein
LETSIFDQILDRAVAMATTAYMSCHQRTLGSGVTPVFDKEEASV